MEFKDYLKLLVMKDGSDLYLIPNAPPSAKFQGKLTPLSKVALSTTDTKSIAYEIMNDDQIAEFEHTPEMNLAISEAGIGRFRVNIYQQRSNIALVIRNIVTTIPNADDIGLPDTLKKVIMAKRGLVLFVGGTGSGKSTSLAALIDYRNTHSRGHIITIEDPIEYLHSHKNCIISQREVGVDTESFADALKNTLRQAPDVILIGEIRDRETMEHALAFAETGHLAISTLHANNANQALDRIINFFPEERRTQLLMDLSSNIQAFVSQRLIPTLDKKRCAAIEIMLGTPRIRELVLKGEFDSIKETMQNATGSGMQTFDQALIKLANAETISEDEAIKNADSQNNVRLQLSLQAKGNKANSASGGLSLIPDEPSDDKDAQVGT
ncbi:MAG: PilT/PilU family type 4a pilus ATPase [Thiohalomonadales bacterium]